MKAARLSSLVVLFAVSVSVGAAAALVLHFVSELEVDRSIKPGDDFYLFANGNWLKNIPAGRTAYDTRTMLAEKAGQQVKELLERAAKASAPAGSIQQKVGDYYASYLDQETIEARGMKPLDAEMARITAIADKKQLAEYLGGTLNTEVDGLTGNSDHLFGAWVNQSFTDSHRYVFHLQQGGLGVQDRDFYIDPSEKTATARTMYEAHIAEILRLSGVDDAAARAKYVLDLETAIAQSHAPDSEAADVFKQNNEWKREEFTAKAPGLDWNAYFRAAGINQEPMFVVWQPQAMTGAAALVASQSLEVWKDYLRFHATEHFASVLPKAVGAEMFAYYGKARAGEQQPQERSSAAIAATNAALGQAVGQLYTAKCFPPQAKAKSQAMVSDLFAAYRARIANLTWMSAETKHKALTKLAALKVGTGYPDKWIDYSTLKVIRGDAFGNLRRAEEFNRVLNLAKLKRPADVGEWRIDAQIVGAIIIFSPNAEQFSAALLQPPFFDTNGDNASNYGSAGAGMAHEISHSFDELGNIYDDQGRLGKWWTAEDEANYHAAAAKYAESIGGYCPFADACMNGKQVVGESMSDLAGLTVAHDAYILSLKGKKDVVINGLTGEQRFFLAFAQRWRKFQSDDSLRRQVKTDIHLPPQFRSNAVRNFDAWYDAYAVTSGDKLYVEPEARARIW